MHNSCLLVQVLKTIEHLAQEEAARVFTKSSTSRSLDQIEEVYEVSAEVFCHKIRVGVIAVSHALHVHDASEAVTEHTKHVFVVDLAVVLDLSSHLHLVLWFFVRAWPQNLQHNELAVLLPVLG